MLVLGVVLGFVAVLLVGCGGRQEMSFAVGHESGVLVIARFERRLAAGTETRRTLLGHQVTTTGADGTFTLRPPGRLPIGELGVRVVASQPGHALFIGAPDGDNTVGPTRREGGRLLLAPTEDMRAERLAIWLLEREASGLCEKVEPEACRLIEGHLATRRAWFREHFADAADALDPSPPTGRFEVVLADRRALDPSATPPPEILGVAGLGDGAVAVVHTTPSGRALAVVEGGAVVWRRALVDRGRWAAVTLDDQGQAVVYDDGGLLTLGDDRRTATHRRLADAPGDDEAVRGVALAGDRMALVVQASDGTRLELRDAEGRVATRVALTGLARPESASFAPDGAALVSGALAAPFDYGLRVGNMAKKDAMPRGVLRVAADGTVAEQARGVDTAVVVRGTLWGYARDLHDPADEAAIRQGFTKGVVRQARVRFGDDGRVEEVSDVSDAAVGDADLRLGPSVSGLVLYGAGASAVGVVRLPAQE